MSGGQVFELMPGAALALLLGAACVADLRQRRIPNALALAIALVGVANAALRDGQLLGSLGGIGTGLAIWLPFWLFGMLGAGDVKLFAASAAWLTPRLTVEAALVTALAGGVVSLVLMIAGRGVAHTLVRLGHAIYQPGTLRVEEAPATAFRLPYAFAIATGILAAFWRPGLIL